MKKIFVCTLAALSLSSVFAHTSFADASTTKREISNLARAVQDALIDTNASDSNLNAAKSQLQSALNLLRQNGGGGNGPITQDCVNFAYNKYYQSLTSADAMTKAGQACRKSDSLEVMQFLYEKHYQSLTAANAMDAAAEGSRAPMAGKLDIVKYAYEKYYQALTATSAATKAADGARKVEAGSLGCVQSAYNNYYNSQTAANAMDSAFAFCAN